LGAAHHHPYCHEKRTDKAATSDNHFYYSFFSLYSVVQFPPWETHSLFTHIMQEFSSLLILMILLSTPDPWKIFVDRQISDRPGIEARESGGCPPSHPIKGNFTTYSGERCIYHLPDQHFYSKTKIERCYATGDDARRDGCRKANV
jgi:hypothetical protein